MKIAFLSHLDLNLYLFRLPIMKKLVELGHKVYAICPEGEFFSEFEKYGIVAISYNIERNSINPIKELRTISEIKRILKSIKPDVLHTFMHKPNIYGGFAGIPNFIQTVTGLGSFYIHKDSRSILVRETIEGLYRVTSKSAKKVIFQNEDDKNHFIRKRIIPHEKAVVIKGSGVDTTFFKPSPPDARLLRELNIDGSKPIVLMVARVIKDKGVEEYIKAANMLRDKAVFLYAGNIDEGNPNAFVPDWRGVKYLGFRKDIKELLSITDIFVLPSYREGIPRTLLEAAAMAKPIVTTDTVGCREVVEDGKNGFLVPVRDVLSLAKKIELLIDNEDLRKKFGKYGRKKILIEFDIEKIVGEYIDLYNEIVRN